MAQIRNVKLTLGHVHKKLEEDAMDRFSANFEVRLKHFGIQPDLLKTDKVTINKKTGWDDQGAPFPIKVHRTKSLDEVKRLIGNPDKQFEKETDRTSETHSEFAKLKDVSKHQIGAVASAYVFGNSKPLAHLAAHLENAIGEVVIHVAAANELVVDQVIEVSGKDPKVITVDRLIFTKNGRIISTGMLTINAGTIVNQSK